MEEVTVTLTLPLELLGLHIQGFLNERLDETIQDHQNSFDFKKCLGAPAQESC